MINSHVFELIKKNFNYPATDDQIKLIQKLAEFILYTDSNRVLIIKGYAGTGKTSIISAFVKTLDKLKIQSFLLAPTGRAAKILMNYSGKNAYTVHKKIYRQKSSKDGFGEFVLDINLHKNTFFIVDESSMISNSSNDYSIFGSGRLLDDLITYVYNNNCKLILVGDTAQLPPVGLDISPALDKTKLEEYDLIADEAELTQVVRQSQNSGILINATSIRNKISINDFVLHIKIHPFLDVERINGSELIDSLESSIQKTGINETIVICRSNKRANKYNEGIRNSILFHEHEICVGDLLMVVKNNYYWIENNENIDFIANGDIIEITKIHSYKELYGFRFAEVTIKLPDYQNTELKLIIMLDTLMIETAALPTEKNKELFFSVLEDYSEEKTKKKKYQKVKEDKYFNALQVKFAYAVTCHKSQGGQWKNVYIDAGFLTNEMIDKEYFRWLYTAFTRATEKLYLINFDDRYFG